MSARSPGENRFTTEASSPPVPEHVKQRISFCVENTWPSRTRTWFSSALNSAPRWLIIWLASDARTDSGIGTGPGIRRFCADMMPPLYCVLRTIGGAWRGTADTGSLAAARSQAPADGRSATVQGRFHYNEF